MDATETERLRDAVVCAVHVGAKLEAQRDAARAELLALRTRAKRAMALIQQRDLFGALRELRLILDAPGGPDAR